MPLSFLLRMVFENVVASKSLGEGVGVCIWPKFYQQGFLKDK